MSRKRFKNKTGDRYGRLTLIEMAEDYYWKCRCDCGEEKTVKQYSLRNGDTKSCGCLQREITGKRFTTHGLSHTTIYETWRRTIRRCEDPNDRDYEYRGAVGVGVCEEWRDFTAFHAWAVKNGHREGLDLCLIDDRKDYGPDNCRFMTHEEGVQHSRRANLDADKVRDIRARYATGFATQKYLALEYGVTQPNISNVVNRKTWKNIP